MTGAIIQVDPPSGVALLICVADYLVQSLMGLVGLWLGRFKGFRF